MQTGRKLSHKTIKQKKHFLYQEVDFESNIKSFLKKEIDIQSKFLISDGYKQNENENLGAGMGSGLNYGNSKKGSKRSVNDLPASASVSGLNKPSLSSIKRNGFLKFATLEKIQEDEKEIEYESKRTFKKTSNSRTKTLQSRQMTVKSNFYKLEGKESKSEVADLQSFHGERESENNFKSNHNDASVYNQSRENLITDKPQIKKRKTIQFKQDKEVDAFLRDIKDETQNEKWNELEEMNIVTTVGLHAYRGRKLNHTKLIYDSLSEDEDDDLSHQDTYFRCYSIHPKSDFAYYFNLIQAIFLLLYFIFHPINLCFSLRSRALNYTKDRVGIIGLISDFIFLIAFILKFFTGYYKEETVIFRLSKVTFEFLTNGFIFDFFISFPFNLVYFFYPYYDHTSIDSGFFSFIYYGKWIRLGSIFKVWDYIDYFFTDNETTENSTVSKQVLIFKSIICFLIATHYFNCIWIFIGFAEATEGNWLSRFGFIDIDDISIYLASFYFNMVTILTVGYGDIAPATINERLYISIFLFFSNLIYSFIISWMSSVISEDSRKQILLNQKKEVMNRILNDYSVSEVLVKQIKKSLAFMVNNSTSDVNSLLNTLPDGLKNQIYKRIYEAKIGKLEFFKEASDEFILYCIPRIEQVSLKKSETLISMGDIFTEMFMVNKGSLNFYLSSLYNNFRLNSIGKGYHFGDVNMYLNEPSEYTIKAASNSNELFTMKKNHYSELKRNFPGIIEDIIKNSIDNYTDLELLKKEACIYFENIGTMQGFRLLLSKKLQMIHYSEMAVEEQSDLMQLGTNINLDRLSNLVKWEQEEKVENVFKINTMTQIENFKENIYESVKNNKTGVLKLNENLETINNNKKKLRIRKVQLVQKRELSKCDNKFKVKKIFKEDNKARMKKTKGHTDVYHINNEEKEEAEDPEKVSISYHKIYKEDSFSIVQSCALSNLDLGGSEQYHDADMKRRRFLSKRTKKDKATKNTITNSKYDKNTDNDIESLSSFDLNKKTI